MTKYLVTKTNQQRLTKFNWELCHTNINMRICLTKNQLVKLVSWTGV